MPAPQPNPDRPSTGRPAADRQSTERRSERRSQSERSRATRSALTAAARELFTARGYADVPADEIVRAAGVSRGALYHHYADKQELFREVFEQLETEIMAEIKAASDGAPDLLTGMVAGLSTFLDICARPEVLRIGLTDAPAVLGWSTWREIEAKHALGLLIDLLEQGAEAGLLVGASIPTLAQLLLSAIIEAALMVAAAEDRAAARQQAEQALLTLLTGLLKSG